MAKARHLRDRFPDISRAYHWLIDRERYPPFRQRYAHELLHDAILEIAATCSGRYYIEVGANDGLVRSNTRYLEQYLGWTGLLIEPIPHRFVECARNRPDSRCVHCALVSSDYAKPTVEITYRDVMTVSETSPDPHAEIAEARTPDEFLWGTTFFAPARTLDDVLAEAGNPRVDLCSIDVEGAELDLLAGVDLEQAEIAHIVIETETLDRVRSLLEARGYELVRPLSHHDYWFRRRPGS